MKYTKHNATDEVESFLSVHPVVFIIVASHIQSRFTNGIVCSVMLGRGSYTTVRQLKPFQTLNLFLTYKLQKNTFFFIK